MNCPDCGRFMYLWPTVELTPYGASMEDAALHWLCGNPWDCLYAEMRMKLIPAPEYDWLWWGVGDDELAGLEREEPGTAEEFRQMRTRCPVESADHMRWARSCW